MEKTKLLLIPLLGGALLPGPIQGSTSPDSTPIPLVVQSAEPEPSAPTTQHVTPEPLAPPAALPIVAQVWKREKGLYYVAAGGHDLGVPPETPTP